MSAYDDEIELRICGDDLLLLDDRPIIKGLGLIIGSYERDRIMQWLEHANTEVSGDTRKELEQELSDLGDKIRGYRDLVKSIAALYKAADQSEDCPSDIFSLIATLLDDADEIEDA